MIFIFHTDLHVCAMRSNKKGAGGRQREGSFKRRRKQNKNILCKEVGAYIYTHTQIHSCVHANTHAPSLIISLSLFLSLAHTHTPLTHARRELPDDGERTDSWLPPDIVSAREDPGGVSSAHLPLSSGSSRIGCCMVYGRPPHSSLHTSTTAA